MAEAEINEQNALILQWIPKVRSALKTSAGGFVHGKTESFVLRGKKSGKSWQEKKLANSIGSKTGKNFGAIERISFTFERHGIFLHKGVGRGYRADKGGFIIRVAKSPATTTRVADDWFNSVLDRHFPELANRIAEINADAVINIARMMIK